MSQKYFILFSIVTVLVLSVIKSASLDGAAAAAAASGYQAHEPIPSDPIIDNLAVSVAESLLNSPVLGSFADFQVEADQVPSLFFRVGSRLLEADDINDPNVAKIAAQAGREVGLVNSHLYFYTAGYLFAKFLRIHGVLSYDNAEYLALKIVSSIELVACSDGIFDTETMMNAVAYGIFNVLETYGLTAYDEMKQFFYIFAEEIEYLAGKY